MKYNNVFIHPTEIGGMLVLKTHYVKTMMMSQPGSLLSLDSIVGQSTLWSHPDQSTPPPGGPSES